MIGSTMLRGCDHQWEAVTHIRSALGIGSADEAELGACRKEGTPRVVSTRHLYIALLNIEPFLTAYRHPCRRRRLFVKRPVGPWR